MLVVVVLGLIVLLIGVIVALSHRQLPMLGSNDATTQSFTRFVEPGATICEPSGPVPAGTGGVRMLIGTYGPPGPALDLRFRSGPRVVATGHLAAGWAQGWTVVPVRPVRADVRATQVCLRNGGAGRLALAGYGPVFRIEFVAGHPASWWSQLGAVDHHFGQGKASWTGGWTLYLSALLALLAMGVAVVTLTGRRR